MDLAITIVLFLSAICVAGLFAQRLRVAPPITFLIVGIALSFVPGMQHIHVEPDHMLLIFLPPILMEAAFFTSWRDFRANFQRIMQLAFGLVFITAIAVAATLVAIVPGTSWALGLILGAIVSPPDAAAATFALRGVRVPKRITTILEGESLINDAAGLVLYKFTVAAVVTASFSFFDASTLLIWKAVGGVLIGLFIGAAFVWIFPRVRDLTIGIIATFIPPYVAYILGENLHASGVLAVVACGLYVGWYAPSLFPPTFRIPAEAIWKMAVFIMNAVVFLLIGLQLPHIVQNLSTYSPAFLATSAFAICLVTALTRFAYVYAAAYGMHFLIPKLRESRMPAWQNVFVVAWTGMRGVVTIATALALPLTLADGTAFPQRDLLIFLAVCVIVFTIVIQGISLPFILRRLTLQYDIGLMQEEWHTRATITRNALLKLEELSLIDDVHKPALERIREHYRERMESLGDGPNTPLYATELPSASNHPLIQAENRIWQEVLREERRSLIDLRRHFQVGDDVMHDILRDLDLLASRFNYSPQIEVSESRSEWRFWQRKRKVESKAA